MPAPATPVAALPGGTRRSRRGNKMELDQTRTTKNKIDRSPSRTRPRVEIIPAASQGQADQANQAQASQGGQQNPAASQENIVEQRIVDRFLADVQLSQVSDLNQHGHNLAHLAVEAEVVVVVVVVMVMGWGWKGGEGMGW